MTTSVLGIDPILTGIVETARLRCDIVDTLTRALHMASGLDEDVAAAHIQWAIDILGQPILAAVP